LSVNDRIILDKILEQQKLALAPELTPSKFFEIFTAEQILKDYDLSYDEIESGIVGDGSALINSLTEPTLLEIPDYAT
jgi:hypothetical protein